MGPKNVLGKIGVFLSKTRFGIQNRGYFLTSARHMASGKLVYVAVDLTEEGMQKLSLELLQEPLQTVTLFLDPEWRFFERAQNCARGPTAPG